MKIKEFVIRCRRKLSFLKFGYGSFGKNSVICNPLMIYGKKRINIGGNVTIRDGARIEAVEKWNSELYRPVIEIGNGVCIEQNLHLTCANEIAIGEGTSVFSNVVITDIDHVKVAGKTIQESPIEIGYVHIGKNVLIGSGSFVFGKNGINIGDDAVIGANSVVVMDVPAGAVVAGNPAKVIRKITDGKK